MAVSRATIIAAASIRIRHILDGVDSSPPVEPDGPSGDASGFLREDSGFIVREDGSYILREA